MNKLILIAFFASFYLVSSNIVPSTDSFITEVNQCNQCTQNQCCTIGYQRYSYPRCTPLGLEGSHCYSAQSNPPRSLNLSYPNGFMISITNVYRFFCPCADNLECIRGVCTHSNSIY